MYYVHYKKKGLGGIFDRNHKIALLQAPHPYYHSLDSPSRSIHRLIAAQSGLSPLVDLPRWLGNFGSDSIKNFFGI